MGNRDEELIMLIKQIRKGHGDKREFCNSIYKEVYGLVYPLYRNKSESVSVSKKILIEICKKLDDIDVNKNVHRQIATMTSAYLLEEAVSKHEEELKKHTNLKEYEFSRIKEDDEFLQIMREKAVAFRSARDFEEADDNIKSLTDIQLAILELYAYEMRSVDEIEDLTDIDSTFVASWIADTKDIVVGGPIVSKDILEEASLADLDEEDEDETSQDEDSDAEADEESLREADELDLDDERENRRAASQSGKVHRGKGKRSNTARIGNFIIHENPATLLLKKIFPVLTLPMRMMVLWIAGGVVLITLIAVIITSVVMGGKSDKKSNKPETSTQAVTTQAETNPSSTEKSNSTTAASKDDNKATEATTKKTNNTTNNGNNNTTNNNDESSSENETETSSEDTSSETTAGSEETTTAVSETTTAAAQETTTAATATTEASSQETTTAASPATP
ncbi:MAG: hypothetical protein ACI4D4_01655 [Lachnospira sp.]